MRLLLIRHATTAEVGRVLTGWTPGVHLDEEGRAQAERLADRLEGVPLRAIYTSPIERAVETAAAVACRHGLAPVPREGLGEIRLGEWTGRRFEPMDEQAEWRRFNSFRTGARPPGGEWMIEVQARIVLEIQRLFGDHPDEIVAVVSHGDPIKAVLFHYGGVSLDLMMRWEIAPASVSVLDLHLWGARILAANDTGRPPWL